MLGLIVIAIMMGFPTAFTLMGLGMLFGFLAFWTPSQHWYDNQVFDLMVQRTYGVMTNDTLLSVPLFVFMGYIMERAALVDRMFHSVQLAFRRVPASLAVTTLLVCAFWGIASGIVGAVVVLMGVIAMRPMLNAGYDVRLASGAITAGGTLGILIPPSVMLIVYAAVAGESIVKLYAAAMLPGFFLTFLYLVFILGWAIINPKIAPKLPPEQYRIATPEWLRRLERGPARRIVAGLLGAMLRPKLLHGATSPDGHRITYGLIVKNFLTLMVPAVLTIGMFATAWWYVVIYNAPSAAVAPENGAAQPLNLPPAALEERPQEAPQEKLQELGGPPTTSEFSESPLLPDGPPQEMGSLAEPPGASATRKTPEYFYLVFWGMAAFSTLLLAIYYWRMDGEQLEILKELVVSVVPLGVLTVVVLAVILFGITTATESAAVGALGALYLAVMAKYPRQVWSWSLVGASYWGDPQLAARRRSDCARIRVSWRRIRGNASSLVLGARKVQGALAKSQRIGFPDCEDHGYGLLALHWLGAFLRCLCASWRTGAHRTLGSGDEPLSRRFFDHGATDHISTWLAARVD